MKIRHAAIALLSLITAGLLSIGGSIGPRIGPQVGPRIGPRIGTGGSHQPLVLLWGDSNVGGRGDANNIAAKLEFGVNSAFAPVTIASRRAANTNDPPPFGTEFGPTALVAFNPLNLQGYGPEITLGRQLNSISSSFGYIVESGITSSFLSLHWLPTSTYGSTLPGGNLYRSEVARAHSYEATSGRQVQLVIVNLGTNDASDNTAASAITANMGTMVTQLHADFPSAKIVWPLVASGTTQTFLSTVRTQQLTYAGSAPNYFSLLNIDELTFSDIVHWDDVSILHVGAKLAFAGGDALGVARAKAGPAPAIVGAGIPQSGNAGTLSPVAWAGTQDKDTELLIAFCSGVTPGGGAATMTISNPSGWTLVTSGQTTAVGFTGTWKIFSRQVPNGEVETVTTSPLQNRIPAAVSVTFANSTDNVAKRITIRGPTAGNQDVDVSGSTTLNQFATGPFTIGSLNTTVDNGLVIDVVGGPPASTGNVSTITSAGLSSFAKYSESYYPMPSGDAPSIGIWSGTLAAHGATGTGSLSFSLSTLAFAARVVIKP